MPLIQCHNKDCPHYDDTDQPDNCSHPVYMIQDCSKAMIRKDSPVKSQNWYYQELMSNECYCGESKAPRCAFCLGCYDRLPADIQSDLWQIGQTYRDAYEAGVKHLEAS